jgi:hypothetical protein
MHSPAQSGFTGFAGFFSLRVLQGQNLKTFFWHGLHGLHCFALRGVKQGQKHYLAQRRKGAKKTSIFPASPGRAKTLTHAATRRTQRKSIVLFRFAGENPKTFFAGP